MLAALRILVPLMMFCVLMAGCLPSTSVPTKSYYYTLEYAPPLASLPSKQAAIMVEGFSVAPGYNTNRVVYGESPYKLSDYNYHFWRANPGDLVPSFLLRDIRASGMFMAAVGALDVSTPVNYRLSGSVDAFYEDDSQPVARAVVSITVTLLREGVMDPVEALVYQKSYQVVKPCRAKTAEATAEAMSQAVSELSVQVMTDLSKSI